MKNNKNYNLSFQEIKCLEKQVFNWRLLIIVSNIYKKV